MALKDVVTKLSGNGIKSAGEGRWTARCPVPSHGDSVASLSIGRGSGGRALIKCFGPCTTEAVVEALGLKLEDLFEEEFQKGDPREIPPERWPVTAEYVYENAIGEPVHKAIRRTSPVSGRKTFSQASFENGRWTSGTASASLVLYRLPQLLDSEVSQTVFIVEGERDVETLVGLDVIATTNVGGSSGWRAEYAEWLRGRDVVILPDNDDAGRKHLVAVRESLKDVAASVRVLMLPGAVEHGDVTDWVLSGGTRDQLLALVARLDAGPRFLPSPTRLFGERDERLAMASHSLRFGVSFLDDAMGGFTRRDLILLGAKSGQGKTQLAMNIAMQNLTAGKRVHYFMLEGEARELERRMKYKILAAAYYEQFQSRGAGRRIRFADWYSGRLDDVLSHFEPRAEAELARLIKNLHTYYRIGSFTKDDFAKQLDAIREHTDLVILDHFHYIDEDSDKDGENRAHKKIVKQIRDSALSAERPVIAIVHLRKTQGGRYATLVPSGDDFHGSSDIFKVATKAIMLAKDRETETGDPLMTSTFMQVVKNRQDGSLGKYVARMTYNARTESYGDAYDIGQLSYDGTAFEYLTGNAIPDWARTPP